MVYFHYEVGKPIKEFIGQSDGILFDISDTGAMVFVLFNKPTKLELANFREDMPFEVTSCVFNDVIYMCFRFGCMDWMDAPYSAHLSTKLTSFQIPEDGYGLPLNVCVVDTSDGTVKSLRVIGLGTEFSQNLITTVMENKMTPYNPANYQRSIDKTYDLYSSADISRMSENRYKIIP